MGYLLDCEAIDITNQTMSNVLRVHLSHHNFLSAVYSLIDSSDPPLPQFIVSSSTTSVTSMSLLTMTPCPLHPPPQPLSPPCLSSPWHPVHCILLHNLCHLHVSPHHNTLSIESSTTSVTSMSLLTMTPCHWILLHNLCHLHVSPHHDTLSIASSSTTSVTSMSLLIMTPCPLHPPQPLSPPCLS